MTYYTSRKDGRFVEVPESFKKKLIKEGKKTESDFISKSDYEAYNIPAETTQAEPTDANLLNREVESKLQLLSLLKPVYSGDLDKLIDYVRKGGKMPPGMNRKQEQLFSVVYTVMHAKDAEDAATSVNELDDNSYGKFIGNTVARKSLYTDKEGNFRQPTFSEVVAPNFSSRNANGASEWSQGVGLYHDITTSPTRAATAGIASMTPYGQNLSFGQSMGRTVEASTGPENFFDFAASSVPAGAGIVGVAGKVLPKLRGVEKFATAVRDVNGAMKTGKRVIAERALKGAGEGAAYSVAPSAVLATSPEEDSPFATFAEGVGLGAVTGAGIGALGGGSKLASARREGRFLKEEATPYTEELLEPNQALKRLKSAVRREPVRNAADIEGEYETILKETKGTITNKLAAERKKMLEEIEAKIAEEHESVSRRMSKKPQPPESPVEYVMDDVPVVSEREVFDPSDDYVDADYSNAPNVESLPDYSPEDFDRLVTAITDERNALMAESEEAIKIKGSPAYEKMTQREKNRIDSRILTDANKQNFLAVDKAVQSRDIGAITDALGKSTASNSDFDPYEIALGLRSPVIEPPLIPGQPRKYEKSMGIYKESPKSTEVDNTPELIPEEDAAFGAVDEARSIEEPATRLKALKNEPEQDIYVNRDINMAELLTGLGFSHKPLEKYLGTLPVDMREFATKEWNRVNSNLAKRNYAPSTTIGEITRLNKLSEASNDPIKQNVYKDLGNRLRRFEEDISDFYLSSGDPLQGDVVLPSNGLPENRAEQEKLYKVMDDLPAPEKLIKASKSRLETGTRSDFNKLVKQEKALNEMRSAYNLPEVDILSAPVAANIRALKAPSNVTGEDILAGQAKAGRGVILGVGEEALKLGAAYAKRTPKGGYAPALMSDQEFEYASPTDIPVDMLVKGGSSRVLLKAPKVWKSVKDIK